MMVSRWCCVCFNLVIEVLLISNPGELGQVRGELLLFQSRNRGSFDFKRVGLRHPYTIASIVSIS